MALVSIAKEIQYQQTPDERLAAQAADGDLAAFEELVRRHRCAPDALSRDLGVREPRRAPDALKRGPGPLSGVVLKKPGIDEPGDCINWRDRLPPTGSDRHV